MYLNYPHSRLNSLSMRFTINSPYINHIITIGTIGIIVPIRTMVLNCLNIGMMFSYSYNITCPVQ